MAKFTRTPITYQDPNERIHNFEEVCLGYTKEEAIEEAKRCIQCKNPLCVPLCPVNIDIPGFIKQISEENFQEAVQILAGYSALPAVCGRVCPQEDQCEKTCILGKKGQTHIFATKVRCLHCGGSMIRTSTRTRKYEDLMTYAYLKCKNNTLGGDLVCDYKNRINYTDLYNYVEAELIKVMGIYKDNSEATEATSKQIMKVDYTEEIRKLVRTLQITEADLKDKGKVLTNLYIDKTKGIVSDEDYLTISFTLQEERKQLELREKDIKEKIEEIKRLETEKADVEKVMVSYLENQKLTHEIVNETIDYIEIGSKEGGQNRVINIYWKL